MKWLALILVLFVIAPTLLARGGEMRIQEKRGEWGAVGWMGVVRIGLRFEWRVQC